MKYINRNQEAITLFLTSILSIIVSIFANYLYELLKKHLNNPYNIIFFIIIVFNIFIIYKASQFIVFLKHIFFSNIYDNSYVQQAFISMKSLANEQGEHLQTYLESNDINPQLLVDICVENIKNIIKQCFEFFDNTFTSKKELVKTINFEVTFMTKSYIDNEITIPAASNKDNIQPLSMLQRKNNIKIYDNTVTAEVYKEFNECKKPSVHIIQDTNTTKRKKNEKYVFIYKGQGNRIKSSIVLPIVSHRNELLGTLVVHCDVKNFFKKKKIKFWKAILEIFSVEIAKEKLYLDTLNKKCNIESPF